MGSDTMIFRDMFVVRGSIRDMLGRKICILRT